jgi:hypothetical protein
MGSTRRAIEICDLIEEFASRRRRVARAAGIDSLAIGKAIPFGDRRRVESRD